MQKHQGQGFVQSWLIDKVGVALGFGIPPLVVPSIESYATSNSTQQAEGMFADFKRGFQYLLYGGAIIITVDLLLILIFFRNQPKHAPSRAQYARLMRLKQAAGADQFASKGDADRERSEKDLSRCSSPVSSLSVGSLTTATVFGPEGGGYMATFLKLFKNCSFDLLNICYGVNTGVYHTISTLLSVILLVHYPTDQVAIGWIGFTMVIAGLIGSIVAGVVLERTGLYRFTPSAMRGSTLSSAYLSNSFPPCLQTDQVAIGWIGFTMVIAGLIGSIVAGVVLERTGLYRRVLIIFYVLSVVSFGFYISSIYTGQIGVIFFAMFLLGFFQSGFLPLGFEYAAEITYPANEGLSSGILNMTAHIIGIFLTMVSTVLIDQYDGLAANLFMLAAMVLAAIPSFFMKDDLKRQRAQRKAKEASETDLSVYEAA
ncbi:Feline leukemia virus subgroup C receptor-related protein 2 [Sparganum proliferum]